MRTFAGCWVIVFAVAACGHAAEGFQPAESGSAGATDGAIPGMSATASGAGPMSGGAGGTDGDDPSGGSVSGADTDAETQGDGSAGSASQGSGDATSDGGSSGEPTGTDGDGDSAGTTGGAVGSDPCGFPLDGPWVEIEYSQAGASAQSPGWTFSDTPGFTGSDWATQGESWPEVWDVYQNVSVSSDPIGVLAVVGPSAELQLMIGLQGIASYDHATVCLQGRSVSASAAVQFDVYNPLNGCGVSTSMSHDWSMHAAGLDLADCLVPGGAVQAVRIEPTGGSSAIGIKRLNLILHGAVY